MLNVKIAFSYFFSYVAFFSSKFSFRLTFLLFVVTLLLLLFCPVCTFSLTFGLISYVFNSMVFKCKSMPTFVFWMHLLTLSAWPFWISGPYLWISRPYLWMSRPYLWIYRPYLWISRPYLWMSRPYLCTTEIAIELCLQIDSSERETLILPCIFTELTPHNHLFFDNECLSGPYLGKYKWVLN